MRVFYIISVAFATFYTIYGASIKEGDPQNKWAIEDREALAKWPAPSEIKEWAEKELEGHVELPGTLGYYFGTMMTNTIFNTRMALVAYVKSAEDVQKCIEFCNKYGVRPTVKSGGHDYVGRSSGAHTFSINVSEMKGFKMNLNDSNSPSGASAEVESGNVWRDVYSKVDEVGYFVVGGNAISVAVGGYITGGGHSPMSRMHGLGVDNTIGFTLVTPEGHIIKMTKDGGQIKRLGEAAWVPYNDPQLFWAVRGGGGGTFGVVTSFTFSMHKQPEDGYCSYFALYPIYHPLFGKVGDEIMKEWNNVILNKMSNNWGGYVIFNGAAYGMNKYVQAQEPSMKGTLMFVILHHGSCEKAKAETDMFNQIYPHYVFAQSVTPHTSFWEYAKNSSDPVGFRAYIVNRLLQPDDLSENSTFPQLLPDIVEPKRDIGCTWTLLGGKVGKPVIKSSVTPDIRTALGSMSCGLGWGYPNEDEEAIGIMRNFSKKIYQHGKGTYYNEPDYFETNWKEEFWGSKERYDQLLNVKKRYDPKHLFRCHTCVASDIEY